MSEDRRPSHSTSVIRPGALLAIRLLILSAGIIASYLAWTSLSGNTVAGCGPESGCGQVLNSRWAYWFGVPVSLLALVLYAVVLAGTWKWSQATTWEEGMRAWSRLVPCAVTILLAAGWFVSVQIFVLGSFCPFCLGAHVLGVAAAILILINAPRVAGFADGLPRGTRLPLLALTGILAAFALIFGQLIHQPRTFAVAPIGVGTNEGVPRLESTNGPVVAQPAPPLTRSFPVYGMFQLDLYDVPLAGSPAAPHVLVSLFDYTCHHCRLMHPRLTTLQRSASNQVSIVSLPMPLDPECNSTMTRAVPSHTNACEYARIGLAVWRANRNAFEAYNEWFFEPERPRPLETARDHAGRLVGTNALAAALQDPWVDQQLKTNVAIYEFAYRAGYGSMPQLIVGSNVYTGTLTIEDLNRAVVQQVWGQ